MLVRRKVIFLREELQYLIIDPGIKDEHNVRPKKIAENKDFKRVLLKYILTIYSEFNVNVSAFHVPNNFYESSNRSKILGGTQIYALMNKSSPERTVLIK